MIYLKFKILFLENGISLDVLSFFMREEGKEKETTDEIKELIKRDDVSTCGRLLSGNWTEDSVKRGNVYHKLLPVVLKVMFKYFSSNTSAF